MPRYLFDVQHGFVCHDDVENQLMLSVNLKWDADNSLSFIVNSTIECGMNFMR